MKFEACIRLYRIMDTNSLYFFSTWDTLFTSCRVMSFPPVILYTTPVADWIEDPIRGAKVACSAASSARFLLEETPTPSIAVPESFMTAFTSAKSTFTSPGICKRSIKKKLYRISRIIIFGKGKRIKYGDSRITWNT